LENTLAGGWKMALFDVAAASRWGTFCRRKAWDNIAMTLIGFKNLADYEKYREKLMEDSDAKGNVAQARESRSILIEDRCWFDRIGEAHND